MEPTFFPTQKDFRKWLDKNSSKQTELLVGFYKVGSGKPSITWSQSVDEALCFGWIDGVRRGVDEESYSIRFTPRKKKSIWSAVNIKKIEELTAAGLMKPAGLTAFSHREEKSSAIYAYEKAEATFSPEFEQRLKANETALAYFESSPKSYQKVCRNWVMSAKQEVTREKRMNELINDCEAGMKIKSQRW